MPIMDSGLLNTPNPSLVTDTDLTNMIDDFNDNFDNINNYGIGRRTSFYTNSSDSPPATTYNITAVKGANQYIGLTSGASPGALIHVKFPLDADMTPMDSFFVQDVSRNSNTYNITLETQGSVLIYGPGLSTSGVASVQITDNGGFKSFIYLTTNKIFMTGKSA